MTKDKLKVPPQNIEAERFVLGSLMIDKNAIYKVADIIDYSDFYHPVHEKVFKAIFDLFGKSSPIDVVSVSNFLKEKNILSDIGGVSYLSELVAGVSTASHVEHYANAVKDKKLLRDMISLSEYLHEKATNNNDDIDELLDSVEQKILSISQRSTVQRFVNIRDELKGAYDRIEKLHQKDGSGIRGVPTGFNAIDNMLSGLQPSDLIILGARPSVGKTSLALNIASQAAELGDKPVGIFSLEMSKEQITERFLSTQSGIPLWRLRTGRIHSDDEFMVIQNALDKLSKVPLFIDDTPSPTVLQIRSMARRLQMEHGLGFVIIDYLQLIMSRVRSDNVVQQVAEISRGLKGLARELNVPVLALSQLSRGLESRDSKVPKLSDLRDSGCLRGNTLITRADTGEQISIKTLAQRKKQTPILVFAMDDNYKIKPYKLTKAFFSGVKKIYKLKTKSGKEIYASANHPFRTITGWKRLDELGQNEFIASPRILKTKNPKKTIRDDEIKLIAHLIGDGCILPKQPYHYTNAYLENIETVSKASRELFGIKPRIVKQKNWYHVYLPSPHHLTHRKPHPITKWFDALNIKRVRSYEKEIPQVINELPENKIALFLNNIWATDGNLSFSNKTSSIYYATSSSKLAHQIQHLLLKIGILSRIKEQKSEKYRTMYHVTVSSAPSQLDFIEKVGIADRRSSLIPKIKKHLELIETNTNVDVIPQNAWSLFIEPAKELAGLSWRNIQSSMGLAYNGSAFQSSNIGRHRMSKIASVVKSKECRQLANSDIIWDQISSIELAGEEEVYDATVPGVHNFVANDIIVHNSIEQDADVVMFIHRKGKDNQDLPEDEQNIADIIIAKHRNGPTGTVKLKFDAEKASFFNIDKIHTDDDIF